MNNNLKINSHETLRIGIILSFVGGILDAHTFLFRNGVFANTQTGNIVLLALFLNTNNTPKTTQCILSIAAFVIGVILTELIKVKLKNRDIFNYVSLTLTIEILFLTIIATIPKDFHNTTVIVIISFICSLQTNAFKSLHKSPYSTTMCTGNLRSASSYLFSFIYKKSSKDFVVCFRYFIIIISFFVGALFGKVLTNTIGVNTLLVCSLFLTTALLILILQNKKLKNLKWVF